VSQQEKRRIHAKPVKLIDDHEASTRVRCLAAPGKHSYVATSPWIALHGRVKPGRELVPAKVKATVGDPRRQ